MLKKYKDYCRGRSKSSCAKSSVCFLTKGSKKRKSYCRKGKRSNALLKTHVKDMTRSQRSLLGHWAKKEMEQLSSL
jgi:hypothetical protein